MKVKKAAKENSRPSFKKRKERHIMTVQEYVERARKAQAQIANYTQEQIDKIVYEGAKVIYKNAKSLAEQAVAETGLGFVEDKIAKNTETPAAFWDYLKDKKTVGVILEDKEQGLIETAHPVGVIAAITPATNPNVTPLGNFMHAVKGRNAVVICPAPRAQKSSTRTVELIREAIEKCGAPADLVQIIEDATISKSAELMGSADLIVATGSFGLTKAAYSSGKPAYGVGPGNPPVILDRGFDIEKAAKLSYVAIGSDNGILCDGENLLLYPDDEEKELFAAMRKEGIVIFEDDESIGKLRDALFIDGKSNPKLVGKNASVICEAAGIEIPADTKVIAVTVKDVGSCDILNEEILGPIVGMKSYDTFENAVDMAIRNMEESGGIGHTAGIFSNDEAHIKYFAERVPVCRLLINQPTPDAWGPSTNSLSPAVSESCGTWGNNILSGNVDYMHFINITRAVYPLDKYIPTAEEVFAD